MKKAIALLAVALVIPTSVAVAKSNPTRGKSNPMVMYVLKGTLSGYTAATATTDGQVSITVNHANYHGRALKGTTLTFGNIDVSLMWRHISSMNAEPGAKPQVFNGTITAGSLAGQTFNFAHIPAYNWFDLSTRFSINDHLDLTFTVQNLLNKLPPIVGSTIGSTSFNSGNTFPSTYDALGRRYAVSARLRF